MSEYHPERNPLAPQHNAKGCAGPPHKWQPGQSGNPKGRTSAGMAVIEWINQLHEWPEDELRAILRDKKLPVTKRIAVNRLLTGLERGDMADFAAWLDGELSSLKDLRKAGVNTELVRKARVKRTRTKDGDEIEERDIDLYDRAGADFDRILDRTVGRAIQRAEITDVTARAQSDATRRLLQQAQSDPELAAALERVQAELERAAVPALEGEIVADEATPAAAAADEQTETP